MGNGYTIYDAKEYPHKCTKCGRAAYVSPISGAIACTGQECPHLCPKLKHTGDSVINQTIKKVDRDYDELIEKLREMVQKLGFMPPSNNPHPPDYGMDLPKGSSVHGQDVSLRLPQLPEDKIWRFTYYLHLTLPPPKSWILIDNLK